MERSLTAARATQGGLFGGRYSLAVSSVLVAGIAFTLTDLVTSFVALNEGFSEGNSLLNGMASAFNLGTIESLLIMKGIFIAGITMQAIVGLRTHDRYTKKIMFASITFFMVLFAFVCLNNLYWITS